MKTSFFYLGSLALISSVALAQVSTTSNTTAGPTQGPSAADMTFMKTLAQGDMAEVDAGRLASEKGSEARVRDFGQQMVTDHAENSEQLRALARSLNVQLPTRADSEQAAEKARLSGEDGSRFDADYMKDQVQDHEKTVELVQNEINTGQDPNVKQFAQKTLPVIKHHLALAKEVAAGVGVPVAKSGTR
jgi:putative membrane protein